MKKRNRSIRIGAIVLVMLSLPFISFGQNNAKKEFNLIPQPRVVKVLSDSWFNVSKISRKENREIPDEGYKIKITKKGIEVEASSERGFIWADVTIKQLKGEGNKLPNVIIEDYPEFPIRGFMYDAGRNFVEVSDIKHYIDLISFYKVNVFHWHITDKPAWRIECRVFPQLNDPKYQRIGRDAGRFYTYDEIRDVIRYAKKKGVMIIPEIDMPGHSDYFNAAFGFGMDSPEGMAVLEKCLAEYFDEIPLEDVPYLHIGSDEVHIKDPKGFMSWAENLVHKAGRKTIAWDPGLPGGKETIYQIWRDGEVDPFNLDKDKKFLDSFMGYLNYYDPFILSDRLFYHTPCATGRADEHALGGILCLWNDVRVIDKSKILPHNGMLSGLLPFAERFWNGGTIEKEEPAVAGTPLLAAFQKKMSFHRDVFLKNEDMRWVATSNTPWELSLSLKKKSDEPQMEAPTIEGTSVVTTQYGDVIDLDALPFVRDANRKDTIICIAQSTIYANSDTTIRAFVGFDVSARSNRFSDGIPLQGEWGNGGELRVNGEKVAPPVWEQPGMYRFHFHTWARPEEELPFTDEQFYWMRKPTEISLKKGLNQIEIRVIRHFAGQRFMFAFIPLPANLKF